MTAPYLESELDRELRTTFFADRDAAVACYIKHMGPVEKRSVWLEPTRKFDVTLPVKAPPKIIVSRLVRDAKTGQFFMAPMNWPFLVKLRQDSGILHAWGLEISPRTIARLFMAGFLRGCRISPQTNLIDLESLWEHMQITGGEGGHLFWTPERCKRLSEAKTMEFEQRAVRAGRLTPEED